MRNTAAPIILIAVGFVWLAHELGWFLQWRAAAAIILVVVGIAMLVTEGITKSSVVSGPMLMYCGVAWYLYLQGMLTWHLVWPIGMIVLGATLFVSHLPAIPAYRPAKQTADPSQETAAK
jgi:membrane-bound ClpP family serine protease